MRGHPSVLDLRTIRFFPSRVSILVLSLPVGAILRMQWQACTRVSPPSSEPCCPCQRARRPCVVLCGAVSRQTDGQWRGLRYVQGDDGGASDTAVQYGGACAEHGEWEGRRGTDQRSRAI